MEYVIKSRLPCFQSFFCKNGKVKSQFNFLKRSIYHMTTISLRSILLLSSNHRLDLSKICLHTKVLKAFQLISILAKWSSHINLLDLITLNILGERYELRIGTSWSPHHSLFLLDPNVRLRILFAYNLSLRSSLNVRDYASQAYSTNGNISVHPWWSEIEKKILEAKGRSLRSKKIETTVFQSNIRKRYNVIFRKSNVLLISRIIIII